MEFHSNGNKKLANSCYSWKKGIGLKMQGKLFAVLVAIICAVNGMFKKL